MTKTKQPFFGKSPPSSKTPRNEPDPQADRERVLQAKPSWRVSILETQDPYGWHVLDLETFQRIRDRLKSFESMTWSEIFVRDKKENHSTPTGKLCKKAQDRLEELRFVGVNLVSLRLAGKERIWGIRDPKDKAVLNLLWWDPRHEICPSLKRHT